MVEGDLFPEKSDQEKKNIRLLILDYSKYWYWFVLTIMMCLGAAYFKIRYTVPLHHVRTTLLIKDTDEGAVTSMAPMEMFKTRKKIDDEMILLKSKALMERVLNELSMNTSYYLKGRIQDMEVSESDVPVKLVVTKIHPAAFGKRIMIYPKDNNTFLLGETDINGDLHQSSWKFGDMITRPYASFTVIEASNSIRYHQDEEVIVKFHDIESLAKFYSGSLEIAPANKSSNVLNVGLTGPVWKKSVAILNKLIEVYEVEAIEDKNLTASHSLSFIDDRLKFLTQELTDVEKNVELYKKRNDLTDVSSEAQLYLKSADDYNKQLAEFDIQIDLLKSLDDYLKAASDHSELFPSSLNIQDQTLLILISKFNELQMEKQRMLRTTQPDNPLIKNITAQLANLGQNIGENIKNIRAGLIITRQNLVASSAKFEYRKKLVPEMERQLLDINRQQGVKEGLYLYLLQKREESALSLAASVSNFRVIDPPTVLYPIGPNKPMIYMIAILIGLAIPFSILYIINLLNDKVEDIKDIERATGAPVLGEITRNTSHDSIVVTQERTSPIVEMFRLIRTNLQFSMLGKENKVVLVTSSLSGEGKSFFSINLAASLVLTGKKVVVVGMDLRKPTLVEAMKLSDGPGITNFLISDEHSLDEIIRPSNLLDNLFVISSGPVMPSPTELMLTPKMGVLFRELRKSFDHIIIDSAPIGLVADAYTLAPYLDSTIYIIRRGYTPKDRLAIIQKVFKEGKLNHPMVVLNDSKIGKGQLYGYGYGYTRENGKSKGKKKERLQKVEELN